ncbi:hypothetical protein [Streptomyces sp. NPDC059814]
MFWWEVRQLLTIEVAVLLAATVRHRRTGARPASGVMRCGR